MTSSGHESKGNASENDLSRIHCLREKCSSFVKLADYMNDERVDLLPSLCEKQSLIFPEATCPVYATIEQENQNYFERDESYDYIGLRKVETAIPNPSYL